MCSWGNQWDETEKKMKHINGWFSIALINGFGKIKSQKCKKKGYITQRYCHTQILIRFFCILTYVCVLGVWHNGMIKIAHIMVINYPCFDD